MPQPHPPQGSLYPCDSEQPNPSCPIFTNGPGRDLRHNRTELFGFINNGTEVRRVEGWLVQGRRGVQVVYTHRDVPRHAQAHTQNAGRTSDVCTHFVRCTTVSFLVLTVYCSYTKCYHSGAWVKRKRHLSGLFSATSYASIIISK